MAEFSFGFSEDCLLQLNSQKQLRSVAEFLISNKYPGRGLGVFTDRNQQSIFGS